MRAASLRTSSRGERRRWVEPSGAGRFIRQASFPSSRSESRLSERGPPGSVAAQGLQSESVVLVNPSIGVQAEAVEGGAAARAAWRVRRAEGQLPLGRGELERVERVLGEGLQLVQAVALEQRPQLAQEGLRAGWWTRLLQSE